MLSKVIEANHNCILNLIFQWVEFAMS